jgi:hypothetical protein
MTKPVKRKKKNRTTRSIRSDTLQQRTRTPKTHYKTMANVLVPPSKQTPQLHLPYEFTTIVQIGVDTVKGIGVRITHGTTPPGLFKRTRTVRTFKRGFTRTMIAT